MVIDRVEIMRDAHRITVSITDAYCARYVDRSRRSFGSIAFTLADLNSLIEKLIAERDRITAEDWSKPPDAPTPSDHRKRD